MKVNHPVHNHVARQSGIVREPGTRIDSEQEQVAGLPFLLKGGVVLPKPVHFLLREIHRVHILPPRLEILVLKVVVVLEFPALVHHGL